MSNVYDAEGLLPKRAFRTLTGRPYGKLLSLEGGGKAFPPAPDYAGAARATAQGNLEATRAAAAANRVNQYTPYGNLTYSHNPDSNVDNGWSVTQTLSPIEQQKLDKTDNLSIGLLNTAQSGLGYVDRALSTGGALNEDKLAQAPIQGQSVQDAIMSRLSLQLDRDRESLRTRLANQGLLEGSEGFKNAMIDQGQKENDLYIQAALKGIDTGLAARQQGIQEQYAAQDRPLNIVNALRTGNQVTLPQFTTVPQQQTTQGPDLLQAAQLTGQYNSGLAASRNATIGQLGSSALISAVMF